MFFLPVRCILYCLYSLPIRLFLFTVLWWVEAVCFLYLTHQEQQWVEQQLSGYRHRGEIFDRGMLYSREDTPVGVRKHFFPRAYAYGIEEGFCPRGIALGPRENLFLRAYACGIYGGFIPPVHLMHLPVDNEQQDSWETYYQISHIIDPQSYRFLCCAITPFSFRHMDPGYSRLMDYGYSRSLDYGF